MNCQCGRSRSRSAMALIGGWWFVAGGCAPDWEVAVMVNINTPLCPVLFQLCQLEKDVWCDWRELRQLKGWLMAGVLCSGNI